MQWSVGEQNIENVFSVLDRKKECKVIHYIFEQQKKDTPWI